MTLIDIKTKRPFCPDCGHAVHKGDTCEEPIVLAGPGFRTEMAGRMRREFECGCPGLSEAEKQERRAPWEYP